MAEQTTLDREIAPLRAISGNYPKTVLTLDLFSIGNDDGIKVIHAIDWLPESGL